MPTDVGLRVGDRVAGPPVSRSRMQRRGSADVRKDVKCAERLAPETSCEGAATPVHEVLGDEREVQHGESHPAADGARSITGDRG